MRATLPRIAAMCATVVSGAALAAQQGAPPPQPPAFRGGTELVVIDTQVVARDGTPIQGLAADQFEVKIDGKRRPIVRADFDRAVETAPDSVTGPPAAGAPPPSPARGRSLVLAIDQISFPVTATSSAREAATRVLDRVAPEDTLGLVAFPGPLAIAPTRDRQVIREAITKIIGMRDDIATSKFSISATEAVLLKSKDPSTTKEITNRECNAKALQRDINCPRELMQDGGRIADALEQQGLQTLAGLHGILDAMARVPERRTLFVVSAGLPTSNKPGARPNLDAETDRLARRAAAANVHLYVLYMNVHFLRSFSAAYGKRNYTIFEDTTTFAQGLERFAGQAGGAFFQVQVDADPFVARALRETTAMYLLAVQVEPADRDGKEHFVNVTVKARGATVRFRRIVTIPRVG